MKRSEKKILDLIVQKSLDPKYQLDLWYCSNIFMVFSLPTHKLKDNPFVWKRKTPWCEFTITRDDQYEIPYGCYARMNQIFIDTEVRIKNTNIIDVGRSFNEYVEKVGYKEGRANRALLRQLINYVTCTIKVTPKKPIPGRIIGFHSMISRAWDVFLDVKNPAQLSLSKGQILLDESYAKYVHEHSAPLDMNVIRAFRRNPLALDFYRYLAYRNNDLPKPVSFPDQSLFRQLGTDETNDRKTRMKLKGILKTIQMSWPVKAKFEDSYFELKPSPPAVPKKLGSKTQIRIVDNFED